MEQEIDYKGYRIKIKQQDYPESPKDWDNNGAFLVYNHRSFQVEVEDFNVSDITDYLHSLSHPNDEYDVRDFEDYYIFPIEAYIHSGISLSLFNGTKFCHWDSSVSGYILVNKNNKYLQGTEFVTESMAEERAKDLLKLWNQYLSGEVYGFIIQKPDIYYQISKEKFDKELLEGTTIRDLESKFDIDHNWVNIDSCGGYYGDPEESGCIEEAKSIIDNL